MRLVRREFLIQIGGAIALSSAALPSLHAQSQQSDAPNRPRLPGQAASTSPPRPTTPPLPGPPNEKAILKSDQQGLRKDVDRLLELAQAIKKEVDATDATKILSLSIVKKAEEIEKLAKQIKTLAKG